MFIERSPKQTRWIALILGTLSLISGSLSAVSVVRSEITGYAIYSQGPRGIIKIPVTRDTEPEKFRETVNQSTFSIILYLAIFSVCFYFYRLLSS